MINTIATILGIHRNSYFNYKKQGRPIIKLLEKYFNKEDLLEFLNTNKIQKLEKTDFLKKQVIEKNRIKYLSSFMRSEHRFMYRKDDLFVLFYFSFLIFLKQTKSFYAHDFQYLLQQHIFNLAIVGNKIKFEPDCANLIHENNNYINLSLEDFIKKLHRYLYLVHFKIFKEWDSYMLLFIQECFETDFQILLNENDSEDVKKEALYQMEQYKKHTTKDFNELLYQIYNKAQSDRNIFCDDENFCWVDEYNSCDLIDNIEDS